MVIRWAWRRRVACSSNGAHVLIDLSPSSLTMVQSGNPRHDKFPKRKFTSFVRSIIVELPPDIFPMPANTIEVRSPHHAHAAWPTAVELAKSAKDPGY